MTDVVGGTPVVQLIKVMPVSAPDLFVKLEWINPTGSYKNRMAPCRTFPAPGWTTPRRWVF